MRKYNTTKKKHPLLAWIVSNLKSNFFRFFSSKSATVARCQTVETLVSRRRGTMVTFIAQFRDGSTSSRNGTQFERHIDFREQASENSISSHDHEKKVLKIQSHVMASFECSKMHLKHCAWKLNVVAGVIINVRTMFEEATRSVSNSLTSISSP